MTPGLKRKKVKMKSEYEKKYFVLTQHTDSRSNLSKLNELLDQGWQISREVTMPNSSYPEIVSQAGGNGVSHSPVVGQQVFSHALILLFREIK